MMNILMTSTTFIPSVLLCGHCQLDYEEKRGKINYKFIPSHFVKRENVEWADVIVFGRSDTDLDAHVAKIASKAGKHLVYYLDDDILNCPSYLSCYPYYALSSTQNNIRKCMSYCDTFLTPSPVLLEKYGENFKHKFLISEPSLNRIEKKAENKKVKIGFAGSIDRTQDINNILENAIRKLVEKYGDQIEIEFMGAKPKFLEELNLKFLPYQDGYDAYTAFMARCNWDIGLAPMPQSDFHRCKYFNKFVEYASFGIAGVYSNCEPYVYGIEDRVNGLLVNNTTEEWFNGICELIDNKKLRKEISDECLKQADEKYSLKVLAPDYLAKLVNDFKPKDKYGTIHSFVFAKFLFFVKRVYRKIKEQGKDFPVWLRKKITKKLQEKNDNIQYDKNTNNLKQMIANKETIFVLAPYSNDNRLDDKDNERIRYIDKTLLKNKYVIYLNGEDRGLEHIKTTFIDDRHATVEFNSFDISQSKIIVDMVKIGGVCLTHSVIRFIREKMSSDMFEIFDCDGVVNIWDCHGAIPEEYGELNNIHTQMVTNDIEKILYEKSNYLLCENEDLKKHFIDKYGKSDIKIIVYATDKDKDDINSVIK